MRSKVQKNGSLKFIYRLCFYVRLVGFELYVAEREHDLIEIKP